jgi:hypothetical protein
MAIRLVPALVKMSTEDASSLSPILACIGREAVEVEAQTWVDEEFRVAFYNSVVQAGGESEECAAGAANLLLAVIEAAEYFESDPLSPDEQDALTVDVESLRLLSASGDRAAGAARAIAVLAGARDRECAEYACEASVTVIPKEALIQTLALLPEPEDEVLLDLYVAWLARLLESGDDAVQRAASEVLLRFGASHPAAITSRETALGLPLLA